MELLQCYGRIHSNVPRSPVIGMRLEVVDQLTSVQDLLRMSKLCRYDQCPWCYNTSKGSLIKEPYGQDYAILVQWCAQRSTQKLSKVDRTDAKVFHEPTP